MVVVPFKNRRGIEGKDDGQETVPISVSCYPAAAPFHPSFFSLASSPLDSFFPSSRRSFSPVQSQTKLPINGVLFSR